MLRPPLAGLALATLALAAFSPAAQAGAPHRSGGHTGVGLGGGTAGAGISVKHFTGDASAIQGVVGTYGRWGAGSGLGLNADVLYEGPALAEGEALELGWNLGAGAGLGFASALGVGVSGVAGLELAFVPIPLDLTLEFRPTLAVSPVVGLDLINFSGHLRWFF